MYAGWNGPFGKVLRPLLHARTAIGECEDDVYFRIISFMKKLIF